MPNVGDLVQADKYLGIVSAIKNNTLHLKCNDGLIHEFKDYDTTVVFTAEQLVESFEGRIIDVTAEAGSGGLDYLQRSFRDSYR